jgi:phosphoglycerate dehydrogenase-like enzyme
MKILVYHRDAETLASLIGERFPELEVVATKEEALLPQHINDADVLIAFRFPSALFKEAKKLRWIQATGAGVDPFIKSREYLRGVIVTNTRGIHAQLMADYTFGAITALQWNLSHAFRSQQHKEWHRVDTRPLAGMTLGLVGLGAIGGEIARRARIFGMKVIGVRRTPAPVKAVDQVFGPERLTEMLSLCDFAVLIIPATPETYHMIGRSELLAMKRTAYLINISRGSAVDEPALIQALRQGSIAGAVLDVFEQEPLPAESPLWSLENVIITPHIAGSLKNYVGYVMEIFSDNLTRWRKGLPLRNVVDLARGY